VDAFTAEWCSPHVAMMCGIALMCWHIGRPTARCQHLIRRSPPPFPSHMHRRLNILAWHILHVGAARVHTVQHLTTPTGHQEIL
jgi:hypothetical protein